jgi:hypothetical protein
MGPLQSDHNKWLITLPEITLSGFHSTKFRTISGAVINFVGSFVNISEICQTFNFKSLGEI